MKTVKPPQRMEDDRKAVALWSPAGPAVEDFGFEYWNAAKPINVRRYWSGAEAPEGRRAEARVIWSEEALHILFDCHQNEPLVVEANPRKSRKAFGLWDRDVCEVFIAPDSSRPENYFEFEAAPNEEWLDVGISFTDEGRQSDWSFHSGITVAAKSEKRHILISMRIPWSRQIPKPRSGERWRTNFFRCVGSGDERGYLAWQPTLTEKPNFHVPDVLGWLEFG